MSNDRQSFVERLQEQAGKLSLLLADPQPENFSWTAKVDRCIGALSDTWMENVEYDPRGPALVKKRVETR